MRKGARKAATAYGERFDLGVSETELLYDQLARRYEEIRGLQSLKDSLVQMIVHDFRNHLTGITGYLDLLGEGLKDGACTECRIFVAKARFHVDRIGCMAADLLDLGRLEENRLSLQPENTPLRAVVDESLGELRQMLEDKRVVAVVEEPCPGACVDVDRRLFSRVVGNVLSNGIRYSPEGGTIRLVIGSPPGAVSLSISNVGPKIPEEALTRIFEKFYQVEARAPGYSSGTGLGLAFCDMVVRAHGGRVEAKNNPGRGCTFTICLPRPREAMRQAGEDRRE